MNLLPYVHAVITAAAVLPEELANRILELASHFEASCDKAPEPDWEAFDSMEAFVCDALNTVHGFQDALDRVSVGMFSNENALFS